MLKVLNIKKSFGEEIAENTPILYGGSVNAENVDDYVHLDNVDGVLVGGASLKANDFLKICQAVAR